MLVRVRRWHPEPGFDFLSRSFVRDFNGLVPFQDGSFLMVDGAEPYTIVLRFLDNVPMDDTLLSIHIATRALDPTGSLDRAAGS